MADTISMTVKGLPELVAKLNANKLTAGPSSRFFRSSGFIIEGRAKVNAGVDTGFLRNSIGTDFDPASPMRFVRVGTNAINAAPQEFGTRPHFPPISAIEGWARRHGLDPFLVARGIARHGTKAHPFLVPALEQSRGDINGLLAVMAADIESGAAI